jgi:hypothetical protein
VNDQDDPAATDTVERSDLLDDERADDAADRSVVTAEFEDLDQGGPSGRRRRFDRGLLVASMVIAGGLMLIVWGVTAAITGDDGIDRPEAIESVQPVENAVQVLQQERIVVDLAPGYEGRLIIDGVELPTTVIGQTDVDPNVQAQPGQQVELPTTAIFDPGNAVLSFQPTSGAPVETLEQGTREATVVYWKIEEGPEQARSYTWTFEVV